MTDPRVSVNANNFARQAAPVAENQWIRVDRHYHSTSSNTSTMASATPIAAQQPFDMQGVVGLVLQHSREEPWDPLAMVQAPHATTANPYDYWQHHYQSQPYGQGNDAVQQGYTSQHNSSTVADHGSPQSEKRNESSEHGKTRRDRKSKSHSKSKSSRK